MIDPGWHVARALSDRNVVVRARPPASRRSAAPEKIAVLLDQPIGVALPIRAVRGDHVHVGDEGDGPAAAAPPDPDNQQAVSPSGSTCTSTEGSQPAMKRRPDTGDRRYVAFSHRTLDGDDVRENLSRLRAFEADRARARRRRVPQPPHSRSRAQRPRAVTPPPYIGYFIAHPQTPRHTFCETPIETISSASRRSYLRSPIKRLLIPC